MSNRIVSVLEPLAAMTLAATALRAQPQQKADWLTDGGDPQRVALTDGPGVTLRQGTNICAAPAPDGRIAFALVNAIWLLEPGGAARKLTDELQDATQPDFSPDGHNLVFQSYRDGNFHLWTMSADGFGLRQLTAGGKDHREPKFSPRKGSCVRLRSRGRLPGVRDGPRFRGDQPGHPGSAGRVDAELVARRPGPGLRRRGHRDRVRGDRLRSDQRAGRRW